MSREGVGNMAHLSFHGAHEWHLEVPGTGTFQLEVTPEIVPGVRRALSGVIAPSACTLAATVPGRVTLVQLPLDREQKCRVLDVFLADEGATISASGPAPAWSVPLGEDGATAHVFGRREAVRPTELAIAGPEHAVRSALEEVHAGRADYLAVLGGGDRPIVILDGPFELPWKTWDEA